MQRTVTKSLTLAFAMFVTLYSFNAVVIGPPSPNSLTHQTAPTAELA